MKSATERHSPPLKLLPKISRLPARFWVGSLGTADAFGRRPRVADSKRPPLKDTSSVHEGRTDGVHEGRTLLWAARAWTSRAVLTIYKALRKNLYAIWRKFLATFFPIRGWQMNPDVLYYRQIQKTGGQHNEVNQTRTQIHPPPHLPKHLLRRPLPHWLSSQLPQNGI